MYEAEYSQARIQARWLEPTKAQHAYAYALRYSHPKRLGLNEQTVEGIDRLVIESYAVAKRWLAARLPAVGTVQVVYSESNVAVLNAIEFAARWHEIFVPARDDAVVLHNDSATVLFYCHEEELEIGQRNDLVQHAASSPA
jgi:hypothetical protein